nr:dATP/dGTP diphosphohydrolase domain-containing protein [uncultured Sphingomonas sp.]
MTNSNSGLNLTKPLQLEDGREAIYLHTDSDGELIVRVEGDPAPRCFKPCGRHYCDELPRLQNVPTAKAHANSLPEEDAIRNEFPMFDGLMAYFPNALAEVAWVSKIGNDQHNPGQDMHWDRSKSRDHGNKIMRHTADMGGIDPKGVRHTARLAWRSLAALQEELELALGLPPSRASSNRPF